MLILASLIGKTCPACHGAKRARQSFCPSCYGALPDRQRRALYQRFGEGYEAAFEEAMETLGAREPAGVRVNPRTMRPDVHQAEAIRRGDHFSGGAA